MYLMESASPSSACYTH